MCGGQHLRCVGVEGAVVDVETERNGAVETEVLRSGADLCVTKEKDHFSGYQQIVLGNASVREI